MPNSQSSEPGFESLFTTVSKIGYFRSLHWRPSSLSGINEYLAIDSGGNMSDLVFARDCCMVRMLPGEAELVSEWTGLPGKAKSVKRFERSNGLYTALYKNYLFLTYIVLSLFAVYRLLFLLYRLERYLEQFVSTVIPFSHSFVSQFGLALFYGWKTPKMSTKTECSVDRQGDVETATTSTATTAVITATDWVKMATTRVYTITTWKVWFRNHYVAHAFVVCKDYYTVCGEFEI